MTPTEIAQNLLARGYEERQSYTSERQTLNVGDRIRKTSQRFGYETGTGTLERIFQHPHSSWSQKYRGDDVELIVKNDDGTYSFVANYHVVKVG